MNDIIFYGGGVFAILYLLFIDESEDHDNQNDESNDRSNSPFPMSSPKLTKEIKYFSD
jgi:hypothetical protein